MYITHKRLNNNMCGIYHVCTMNIEISFSCIYVQFNAIYQSAMNEDNLMLKPEMVLQNFITKISGIYIVILFFQIVFKIFFK
jgi:hypothetical protein